MRPRELVVAAVLASFAAMGLASPAGAQVSVHIDIGVPPPALRYEPVPEPRGGYVWVAGYWAWTGHRHEWVGGHWERVRRGYVYRQPHWIHEGERWRFNEGFWEQERRHDNRHDDWHDRGRDRDHDHDHDHDRDRH